MLNILVVMNDIFSINPAKDSSLAMLLAAQKRGWQLFCCDSNDLFADPTEVYAKTLKIKVNNTLTNFITIIDKKTLPLTQFSVVLMRKDPPFDINYIYTTYLLEQAEKQGVLIVNKPQSLRDFNEKLSILNFPDCIPKTLVSSQNEQILTFLNQEKMIVIKPLNGMGGQDIFRLTDKHLDDAKQKITQLTHNGITLIMAQQFLPEITQGDKRILLINGQPVPYALNRIPSQNNWKGNLTQGAIGIAQPLSNRDNWLCEKIAPTLKEKDLLFVGLDVIGDYITEINITSPTGIIELNKQCGLDIAGELLASIEQRLPQS